MNLYKELKKFAEENHMSGKGPLCVALIVTKHAQQNGLPLNSNELLTEGEGQVKGLGKASVQSILKNHGIDKVLAREGGRTSRGSVANMRKYVSFLNALHEHGIVDLDAIEGWWVERVREFFASKPFTLRHDPSKSLRAMFTDLLAQAENRQLESSGNNYVGTMLQHLVGAKLNLLVAQPVKHHGATVADECLSRDGDFVIEDVAIHVTTSPTEDLLRKCKSNLDNGLKSIVITTQKGSMVASGLAEHIGIEDRIDVFEAEQFLAGNIYEIGKFAQSGRRTTAEQLITEYNKIVEDCETDPSLKISF